MVPPERCKGGKTTANKPCARKQGNKATEVQDLSVEKLVRQLIVSSISEAELYEK